VAALPLRIGGGFDRVAESYDVVCGLVQRRVGQLRAVSVVIGPSWLETCLDLCRASEADVDMLSFSARSSMQARTRRAYRAEPRRQSAVCAPHGRVGNILPTCGGKSMGGRRLSSGPRHGQ
jgi:hypothetical protein